MRDSPCSCQLCKRLSFPGGIWCRPRLCQPIVRRSRRPFRARLRGRSRSPRRSSRRPIHRRRPSYRWPRCAQLCPFCGTDYSFYRDRRPSERPGRSKSTASQDRGAGTTLAVVHCRARCRRMSTVRHGNHPVPRIPATIKVALQDRHCEKSTLHPLCSIPSFVVGPTYRTGAGWRWANTGRSLDQYRRPIFVSQVCKTYTFCLCKVYAEWGRFANESLKKRPPCLALPHKGCGSATQH